MRYMKDLFKNDLLVFLMSSVIIHLAFVAIVLSVYQGAPEVLTNSGLEIILEVFEG